jgi:hypothetical protein
VLKIASTLQANEPSFSTDELVYQLNATKGSLFFAHSLAEKVAAGTAKVFLEHQV